MPGKPLISVVVFVLNAADTIDRALSSVTAADQPPVELLVMDGGSTDGTIDVIRRYEPRIAHWRSRKDGSATIALNEGVQRATGDVICLLPADDWIEPGALHLVQRAFAADALLEVLSCGTRFAHLDAGGAITVDAEFLNPRVLEFTMENIVRCPLTAGRFLLRRLYNEVGFYNPDDWMSNDLDFLIRVLLRKPRASVMPELVYTYRQHAGSRTLGGNPLMVLEMMRGNVKVTERHLTGSALAPHERKALLGLHGRSSARLAWMTLARGKGVEAARILRNAVVANPLFPVQVPVWIVQKYLRRGRVF
jgi:glycosyltransferase involved in cell wall biosynthesis